MRKMKCFLGMLLMAAMVFSVLPVNAFAAESDEAGVIPESTEFTGITAEEADTVESDDFAVNSGILNIMEGTCGDILTWTLMPDGTLTIAGSGDMRDYYRNTTGYEGYEPPAWYDYREDITAVVIGDEVTGIGAYAFYDCTNLKTVTMGAGLTYVKPYAFDGCTGITEVYFPSLYDWLEINFQSSQSYPGLGGFVAVPSTPFAAATGEAVCAGGELITQIVIPEEFTTVQSGAFVGCDSLTSVTLHDNITAIGYGAFYNCTGLTELVLPSGLTFVSVSGMAVADCSQAVTLTLYGADGTVLSKTVDSPESYIHRMADGGDIYMAIIKFATSAHNYFH